MTPLVSTTGMTFGIFVSLKLLLSEVSIFALSKFVRGAWGGLEEPRMDFACGGGHEVTPRVLAPVGGSIIVCETLVRGFLLAGSLVRTIMREV